MGAKISLFMQCLDWQTGLVVPVFKKFLQVSPAPLDVLCNNPFKKTQPIESRSHISSSGPHGTSILENLNSDFYSQRTPKHTKAQKRVQTRQELVINRLTEQQNMSLRRVRVSFGHSIFLSETGIKKHKTSGYLSFVSEHKN